VIASVGLYGHGQDWVFVEGETGVDTIVATAQEAPAAAANWQEGLSFRGTIERFESERVGFKFPLIWLKGVV